MNPDWRAMYGAFLDAAVRWYGVRADRAAALTRTAAWTAATAGDVDACTWACACRRVSIDAIAEPLRRAAHEELWRRDEEGGE